MQGVMYGSVHTPPPAEQEKPSSPSPLRVVVPLLLAAAGIAGVVAAASPSQVSIENSMLAAHERTHSPHTLKMSIKSNDYASLNSTYPFLQNATWAEPQREHDIVVHSPGPVTSCAWNSYLTKGGGVYDEIVGVETARKWNLAGSRAFNASSSVDCFHFSVKFPSPGTYYANLTCNFADGAYTSVEEQIQVFYVRRELRELSKKDLNQFLDAFVTMAETPTAEGITKYGKHYRSLTDFQVMHLRAAGGMLTDHMHDGLGVATQHTAMTMEFELAMQSVNPRIAVPYWDYTYDSEMVKRTHDGESGTSRIFTDSWLFSDEVFGRTSTTEHAVLTGRMSKITLDVDYNYTVRSAFGYLRAPWNLNPSNKVTRYHKMCGEQPYMKGLFTEKNETDFSFMWPTCEMHYNTVYREEYDSFFDWAWKISYSPHGPVHAWIGGIDGSCNEWDSLVSDGLLSSEQVLYAKHWAFAMLKDAYRLKTLTFPTYCSIDAVDECKWSCARFNFNKTEAYSALYTGLVPGLTWRHQSFWNIVEQMWCSGTFWPGDHLEASSPIEASFWPVHPTLDRLMQFKDIVQPFTNKTWNDMGDYCIYSWSDCKGHHAEDLTNFRSVTQNEETGEFVVMHKTNVEVREAVLPNTGRYAVAYVYDHFLWSHCADAGYHF